MICSMLTGGLALLALAAPGDDTSAGRGPQGTYSTVGNCQHILDFEALVPGTVVTEVFTADTLGPVLVSGFNPDLAPSEAALIFDSSAPTGEDEDLGTPNETFGGPGIGSAGEMGMPFENDTPLGNVLIVAEDLVDADNDTLIDDPDDADLVGASLSFDFSAFGPVVIQSITVLDVEDDRIAPILDFYGPGGVFITSTLLFKPGDNGKIVRGLGIGGVHTMVVELNGSGAIDDICFANDCNGNSIADEKELRDGLASDCNENGVIDECDIAFGTSLDVNLNGIPDECEPDCNNNGVPDDVDIATGASQDCDGNGVPDECQHDCDGDGIPNACEADCNNNGIPDECERSKDCNGNGIPDECDIADGTSADVNGNGIPDECEPDCNNNGVPDDVDIATGASMDCDGNGVPDECQHDCDGDGIPNACEADCNNNGKPDECEGLPDCNGNGIPDECDIADGTSADANGNGIPDECELDCNGNGVPDDVDIATGASMDCDGNGVPDECQDDCDGDGIPDVCEADCDGDGIPDDCQQFEDCNGNGVNDVCDIADGTSEDANGNGIPDECELARCWTEALGDACGDFLGDHSFVFEDVGDFIIVEGGEFVEMGDGTAHSSGVIQLVGDARKRFAYDVQLSGLVEPGDANYPPAGSPKKELFGSCYVEDGGTIDTNTWRYYTSSTGSLLGQGDWDGAAVDLVETGPAFQIGDGASGKNVLFGGSVWLDWTLLSQPTSGDSLPETSFGDINVDIIDCP